MKKLLCILMVISLFALSACGKNEDTSQSEAKLTDNSTTTSEETEEKANFDDSSETEVSTKKEEIEFYYKLDENHPNCVEVSKCNEFID